MKREEALNKYIIPALKNTWNEEICKEIIEALEQEPILDKIRAEIEAMAGDIETIADVLDIIDKYKTENEV